MFTGDRSGKWLFRALHRAGFANQAHAISPNDGLELRDAWLTAAVRCAPPDNRPKPGERKNCRPYLEAEFDLMNETRVIVALGGFAFDHVLRILRDRGRSVPVPKPAFGHGLEVEVDHQTLIASYHPSQQNTFTGRLTEPMFDGVWKRARKLLD